MKNFKILSYLSPLGMFACLITLPDSVCTLLDFSDLNFVFMVRLFYLASLSLGFWQKSTNFDLLTRSLSTL